MADKEEVEPAAEPSSAELSGASQTSADLKASRTEVNGAAVNGSETAKEDGDNTQPGKVFEPAGVDAGTSGRQCQDGRRRGDEGYEGEEPKGRTHQASATSRISGSVRRR